MCDLADNGSWIITKGVDSLESCLSYLLRRWCPQNLSHHYNYQNHQRRPAILSEKRFSIFNSDIRHFKQWLLNNSCFDVFMESTGKYWISVFNLLENQINVTGKSLWKATRMIPKILNKSAIFSVSALSAAVSFSARKFTFCRNILVTNLNWPATCEAKKRFQNAFTVCNVARDTVVIDIFNKSASSITDYLITSNEFDPETCLSFLRKSLKKKADAVIESIDGYQMTSSQKERMLTVRSHLDFIQQSIASLNNRLDELITPYENAVSLLCTIPEVDKSSTITIISEFDTAMKQFNFFQTFMPLGWTNAGQQWICW